MPQGDEKPKKKRGRPKMTEAQKKAAKEKREAKKKAEQAKKKASIAVRKVEIPKESPKEEKKALKKNSKKASPVANKPKAVEVPELIRETKPQQKVHSRKHERDKVFLMWVGVCFFMLLIMIFWIYNTKQAIEKTKGEWLNSDSSISWGDLADELNSQIGDMKKELSAVRDFASSSLESDLLRASTSPLFEASTETKDLDKDSLAEIQKELEIKTGALEPAEGEYFFEMKAAEKDDFLNNLAKIKIGQNSDEVEDILGKANYAEVLKNKRGVFIVELKNYYLRIYKENEVNDNFDRYVNLEFNEEGVLVRIDKKID